MAMPNQNDKRGWWGESPKAEKAPPRQRRSLYAFSVEAADQLRAHPMVWMTTRSIVSLTSYEPDETPTAYTYRLRSMVKSEKLGLEQRQVGRRYEFRYNPAADPNDDSFVVTKAPLLPPSDEGITQDLGDGVKSDGMQARK